MEQLGSLEPTVRRLPVNREGLLVERDRATRIATAMDGDGEKGAIDTFRAETLLGHVHRDRFGVVRSRLIELALALERGTDLSVANPGERAFAEGAVTVSRSLEELDGTAC